jgi:DNA-binding NarL/FixJ family response regulator
MRILIIDDHRLFIDDMRHIFYSLDRDVDIIVANSAGEAIQHMESSTVLDLVLLDLHMPGLNCSSIIQHQRTQSTCLPIVIISGDDNPDAIKAAVDAGIMGYIPKSFPANKIQSALRTIMSGNIYLPEMKSTPDSDHSYKQSYNNIANINGITKRQFQVLLLLANGESNKNISSTLSLSENTVKAHVSALFRALDASNRTECVNIARNKGIIG